MFRIRRVLARRARRAGTALFTAVVVLSGPGAAAAAPAPSPAPAPGPKSLPAVIAGLQAWLIGILLAVATLFAVLAGVYWATAGGDPAQLDKAKAALRNALVGYGVAVLAPVLLAVVKGIVGG